MKTLKTIQTLAKIGKVLSCIAFIFACIGFGGSVVGALSAAFGGGFAIKLGGVTIYDLFGGARYSELEGVCAALLGWMIVCAGEAVVAKFAELYFKRELAAGTPFTLSGAKELTRLGILTLAVPTGCAVLAAVVSGIAASFLRAGEAMDVHFDNGASIAFGVMFLAVALLCRLGAEQTQVRQA